MPATSTSLPRTAGDGRAEPTPSVRPSLFVPGRNCYRVARAQRLSLIVDGDDYFKAFAAAALRAERQLCIVGWDFHSRTRLHLEDPSVPDLVGDFLNFLVSRRRGLEVFVLIWDYPVLFAKGRELSPIYGFGWRPRRRVHVQYDDCCPIGAAQHQKLVVVDGGALAFCGGLDLARSRWDTSAHAADDERRKDHGESKIYPPFHDTMVAVDGEAARTIDEIVRSRWVRATGRELPRVRSSADVWPPQLPVTLADIDVAVARTVAPVADEPAVQEVEQLYLDMIEAARRSIYIENQYFTSDSLGEALARRLGEPDGPEVIAVLRLSTEGWLEASSMGVLRTVLLRKLREADRHGRFHAFYPHIPGLPEGQCCDLHSKLMIVDDEYVRIGSANFCNRSMGLDTECDLVFEARGDARIADAVRGFRARLLAEHLDRSQEEVEAKYRETGSVVDTIHALCGRERSLRPYERLDEPPEALVAAAGVADPERPVTLDLLIDQLAPDVRALPGGARWLPMLLFAAGLAALAALWRYTPLSAWAEAGRVAEWAEAFGSASWAPLVGVLSYVPAALLLFPRPVITLFAVLAFGAWSGFMVAFAGILLSAFLTYEIGRRLDRGMVRRLAGRRVNQISQMLRRRGLLAVTAVRLVPLAPFAVVNIVAGAIHVRLRHFMGGTALGILPGTLIATVFGDQLAAGLRDPASINIWLIVGLAAALAAVTWTLRRWLSASRPADAAAGAPDA